MRFKAIAKLIAVPVRVCSLPVRVVENLMDAPHAQTAFDDVADAIQDMGKELEEDR